MTEYFCPKCEAILNEQAGFDPSYSTWLCTECDQFFKIDKGRPLWAQLAGSVFQGVGYLGGYVIKEVSDAVCAMRAEDVWFCDECGELLNKQTGFSDVDGAWTCTECFHENEIIK